MSQNAPMRDNAAELAVKSDQVILGERVRELRKSRRMSMRELAAAAEVSVSYISQIENGTANAGIKVLRRLADAFSMQWIYFFQDSVSTGNLLRKADRPTFSPGGGSTYHAITRPPLLDVEVSVTDYEPQAVVGGEDYVHGDVREIFIVTKGTFRVRLDGKDYEMVEGDSLDFRSSVPHTITNIGREMGEGIWVSTPPASLGKLPGAAGQAAARA